MKCTAKTKANLPCRAHAVRGSDPPRCVVHRSKEQASGSAGKIADARDDFYRRSYTVEDLADLVAQETDDSLDDEIAAARVATRRVMDLLQQRLAPEEYGKLARVAFTGANTIARLISVRKNLSREADEGMAEAISEALDVIEKDFDLKL